MRWVIIAATFLARFIVEAWKASISERLLREQGRKEVSDAQEKDLLETRLKAASAAERLRSNPAYADRVRKHFEEPDESPASSPGGDGR